MRLAASAVAGSAANSSHSAFAASTKAGSSADSNVDSCDATSFGCCEPGMSAKRVKDHCVTPSRNALSKA